MDWGKYWEERAQRYADPHQQVARHHASKSVNEAYISKIVAYIRNQLAIESEDHLLDVCCGNGLITEKLASTCAYTVGADISPKLIQSAQQLHTQPNLSYVVADAMALHETIQHSFDKISLYFSFQYFDTYEKGRTVIAEMRELLKPGGKILIGDVPDWAYLSVYYPAFWRRLRYRWQLGRGQSMMGKFWKEEEMRKIAHELDLKIERLQQPQDFLYAHYRTDYLITNSI